MITVDEAIALIREHVSIPAPKNLPLQNASGKVLAQDLCAPADLPAWPQANMDGYAFAWTDAAFGPGAPALELTLCGEIPAGVAPSFGVPPGCAARIFTGAMMPAGADTVVIQERVSVSGDQVRIEDATLQKGANVRPPGSEIPSGALALAQGTLLGPAAIGFVASLGLDKIPVYHPRVSLITTGNELQTPGLPPAPGRVYESNSFALRAALEQVGIPLEAHYLAPDEPAALTGIIREALAASDLLLLTGGVSVGDYDFVARSLAECGVRTVFHGVRQRPGKPLYFGVGDTPVFGLPGNPSSVLTCFYIYVLPALERMCGRTQSPVRRQHLPLDREYRKVPGLTHFLKGAAGSNAVTPLGAQESYRMSTYALANCLIRLPEDGSVFKPGDPVDVYRLP